MCSVLFINFKSYAKFAKNIFIKQIARLYSMRINLNDDKIFLKNNYSNIEFEKTGRRAWINGAMIFT